MGHAVGHINITNLKVDLRMRQTNINDEAKWLCSRFSPFNIDYICTVYININIYTYTKILFVPRNE